MKSKYLLLIPFIVIPIIIVILNQKQNPTSMVAEHKTAVVETTSAYRPPKVVNSYISSIQDDSSCNVKEFDPKADCRVTRALEEHVIRGSRLGGVNFCAYQTLNDDPSEKIHFTFEQRARNIIRSVISWSVLL